jgi:hypothetical protein
MRFHGVALSCSLGTLPRHIPCNVRANHAASHEQAPRADAPVTSPLDGPPGCVMSWMLERRLSFLFSEFRRMKYFCAWLATCARGPRIGRRSSARCCPVCTWQGTLLQKHACLGPCRPHELAPYCAAQMLARPARVDVNGVGLQPAFTTFFKVKANLIEVTCNGGWWPARAWVGVREMTKLREMLRQSPLPYFCRPSRNSRCSSSVHGMPLRRSWSPFPFVCASAHAGAGRGSLVILLKHRTGSDQTVFSYSLSNPHWLNHLKGGTVLSQSEGASQQTEGKSDSAHRSGGDAQRLGRA